MRYVFIGLGATAATGASALIYSLEKKRMPMVVHAGDYFAHSVKLPWTHSGWFSSLDYASVRRGYQVYKQVCAACHSMRFIYYRHFVDVFMTEEEAKAEAAEATYDDTDDKGAPITRPGTLTDKLKSPYPNPKMAAAANNGKVPPDLSLMAWARHGGDDYIYSLLTGYCDPPAGVKLEEGVSYNPYFLGGGIAMAQQLFDEGIEFKDGTPATQSQQAKDVATFLRWAAEPYHDKRKRYALKALAIFPLVAVVVVYGKRHVWSFLKSQKIVYRPMKGREPPSKMGSS